MKVKDFIKQLMKLGMVMIRKLYLTWIMAMEHVKIIIVNQFMD